MLAQESRRRREEVAVPVPQPDRDLGVYGISVAADMVGMGVQTLRLYEARGLITPDRTGGGTPLYNAAGGVPLRRIGQLLDNGLNLAGIAMVFDLEAQNAQLHAEKAEHQWLSSAPRRRRI